MSKLSDLDENLFSLNDDDEDGDDLLLFKIPDIPSQLAISGSHKQKAAALIDTNDALSQLFDGQNTENEDEEDNLIRSQAFASSTQINASQPLSKFIPRSEPPRCLTQLPIMGSQAPAEFLQPTSSDINNNSSSNSAIHSNNNSCSSNSMNITKSSVMSSDSDAKFDMSIWHFALADLYKSFNSSRFSIKDVFSKLTLKYYFEKFYENSLFKVNENIVRKVPLVLVWIKEITRTDPSANAALMLNDGSLESKAILARNAIKDLNLWEELSIGAVLLLKDVYLIRTNLSRRGYHLNINSPNILRVYFKPSDVESLNNNNNNSNSEVENNATNGQIKTHDCARIDLEEIKSLVNSFDKSFVQTLSSELLNNSSSSANSSNASVNASVAQKRPAPYQVPVNLLKNKTNNQTSNGSNMKQQEQQAPASSTLSAPNAFKLPALVTSSNNSKTTFQFKSSASMTVNAQKVISNLTTEISEEVFSQLIFGIEDEFLNDND